MENIGRKLTDEGLENVKKLDTNGNGKLDVDEVGLEDSSDGQDFFFNVCILCNIVQCNNGLACIFGQNYARVGQMKVIGK